MPVVTKPLPAAAVISRQGKLEANVQGVIRFHSSVTFAESTSQASILSLVRDHHVWIARNGDCRLNISVLLDGEFVCGKEKVSRIVRWIENYDLWDTLGIRLRYCGDLSKLLASELPFSIQHRDLTSNLIAPDNATSVHFKLATCLVYIRHKETSKDRSSKRRRSSGRVIQRRSDSHSNGKSAGFYDGLSTLDREAIDKFVLNLDEDEAPYADHPRGDIADLDTVTSIDSIENILQASLYALIDGQSKQSKMQVVDGGPSSCLTRIAPGVFDAVLLKELSERALMTSVAASSLAYMENAESPSLRNKIGSLQASVAERVARFVRTPSSQQDLQVKDLVEVQIWNTLLDSLVTSHRTSRRRPTRRAATATTASLAAPTFSDLTPESSQTTSNYQFNDLPFYDYTNIASPGGLPLTSPQLACPHVSSAQRYDMMEYEQLPDGQDAYHELNTMYPPFHTPLWPPTPGHVEYADMHYAYEDGFDGHMGMY